jgi:hypothetical protein
MKIKFLEKLLQVKLYFVLFEGEFGDRERKGNWKGIYI